MTTLYANPYNIDATGFYFESVDEFTEKSTNLTDRYGNPVEEFEIDFIDGDDAALFSACGINQANLSTWFEDIETLDDHEKINLYYLLSVAYVMPPKSYLMNAGCMKCLRASVFILTTTSLHEIAKSVAT